MASIEFITRHMIVAAALAAAAYLFGRRLTLSVTYQSIWEEVSFSIALGLGAIAYGVLLLGLAGLLYRWVVVAALAIGCVLCRRVLRSLGPRLVSWGKPAKLVKRKLAFAILAIIALSPIWLLAMYPVVAWDATMYHLAMAKIYVQFHHLVFTRYLRYPTFPQSNEMLFTLSLLLYDEVVAQLVELLMLAALAAALVAFGKRFVSARAGVFSAAILLQNPVVLVLGTNPMVDIGVALWAVMSVYAVMIWLDSTDDAARKKWLLMAGAMCGLAVSTKYLGLFFVFILAVVLIWSSIRRRAGKSPPLIFVLTAVAVASPWFIRNFYYTRNPVFPFLYSWFGRWFGWGQWRPEYQGLFVDYNHLGMGKGLTSLLVLPWNLLAHPAAFGGGKVLGLCLILPVIFVFLRMLPRPAVVVFGVGLCYLLVWFFTAQESRYLLPALPLLSLAGGAGLDPICSRLRLRTPAYRFLSLAVVVIMMAPAVVWGCLRLREHGRLPTNRCERDRYLTDRLPAYSALKFLNDRYGRNYTVYAFAMEDMAYFADGRFMGDLFGPARYRLVQGKLNDPAALKEALKTLGADYLLIGGDFARQVENANKNGKLNLMYSAGGVSIFDLRGGNSG